MDAGVRHLAQVVRRDVRGHADGDARRAVQEHDGKTRWEQFGLGQDAVEVGHEVDGAFLQFAEQQFRDRAQARLGVAQGGEGLRVVRRAPVALAVDQRVARGERLREQHHGLVAGGLAVRMELAEHVAHRARRLDVLGCRREAKFGHGVDDAPLHRLQAVADVRQGAVVDDVHRIVEVRPFRVGAQRQPLVALVRRRSMSVRFAIHIRKRPQQPSIA